MIEGLTHVAGWLAIALLLTSLAISLASRWLLEQRARLIAWRRLAGLGSAGMALLHALLALSLLGLPSAEVITAVSALPYLRHGALALALLAALALTSFPKLNARLGLRTWSVLHRAVHVIGVLAALHVLAGPSADPRLAVIVAIAFGLLLLARLAPRARRDGGTEAPGVLTKESADNP